jgi:hypothetical protein
VRIPLARVFITRSRISAVSACPLCGKGFHFYLGAVTLPRHNSRNGCHCNYLSSQDHRFRPMTRFFMMRVVYSFCHPVSVITCGEKLIRVFQKEKCISMPYQLFIDVPMGIYLIPACQQASEPAQTSNVYPIE